MVKDSLQRACRTWTIAPPRLSESRQVAAEAQAVETSSETNNSDEPQPRALELAGQLPLAGFDEARVVR